MATYPNLDFQNFYETTLSNDLAIGATDVFLTIVPTPSEGFLTINPEGASPEIIWYSSKTSSKVVCPAGGRGFDGTTAQAWTSGTKVIMAPVAETQRQINNAASALTTTVTAGWVPLSQTVGAVAYNGNRSYTLTMSADVSATLSPGMRVRTTRTVAAPTQCTSLNGTTQYYNRASASLTGITFTDDFVVSAWVKLNSYGAIQTIASRYNGTNGWNFDINTDGTIRLSGFNGASTNLSRISSYQSIPLNKWLHITAQLDMSAFTVSPTTSYIMIDGVDIPAVVSRTGTNPTSLLQGTGNLEIGARNGGNEAFPGKIAQVAIFSAKVTQATIRGYISQGLSGSETNLISAYSFNNSINDLNTTNANNLTANGSAVATNADSPFSINSFGTATGTTDYGIVTSVATTTVVVQVPEGCTIPTSGGVTSMSYSTQKAPYGMPVNSDKWTIYYTHRATRSVSGATNAVWYNLETVTVPIGSWNVTGTFQDYAGWATSAAYGFINRTLSSSSNSVAWTFTGQQPIAARSGVGVSNVEVQASPTVKGTIETASQTTLYGILMAENASGTLAVYSVRPVIFVELSYL